MIYTEISPVFDVKLSKNEKNTILSQKNKDKTFKSDCSKSIFTSYKSVFFLIFLHSDVL